MKFISMVDNAYEKNGELIDSTSVLYEVKLLFKIVARYGRNNLL